MSSNGSTCHRMLVARLFCRACWCPYGCVASRDELFFALFSFSFFAHNLCTDTFHIRVFANKLNNKKKQRSVLTECKQTVTNAQTRFSNVKDGSWCNGLRTIVSKMQIWQGQHEDLMADATGGVCGRRYNSCIGNCCMFS